ncbi:MAG: glycosyltransferase [Candidatus Hydrogenedens sp.]|nr:glycosyltransferase [Candidatus Hydrogenedens sp.]
MITQNPAISVVVCTHNRAAYLSAMLDSFYAQDLAGASYEVLVVDNASTDETAEIAAAHQESPGFRYVYEPQQGLSHARNRVLAEACGGVVAYLDDDVLVSQRWLAALARCFEETKADVVGGRSLLRFEQTPPPWFGPQFRRMLSEVDLGDSRCDAGDGRRLYGLNLAYRADALRRIGGFDTGYGRTGANLVSGEDLRANALIAAEGGRLVYEPEALVEHQIPAARCEWDYLMRLAQTGVATRLTLDTDAPRGRRAAATLEALAKYMLAVAGAPAAFIRGRESYAWRLNRIERLRQSALTLGYIAHR